MFAQVFLDILRNGKKEIVSINNNMGLAFMTLVSRGSISD
jgi:hypothetical protein